MTENRYYLQQRLVLSFVYLLMVVSVGVNAQTKVTGHVVNERGERVEYVSIGFVDDSVSTISDAKGNFTIEIPSGRRNDLTFTHVSYQTATISYKSYGIGRELTVTLKDKVVELTEIVIGKHNKPKTIAGKALGGPVAAFSGKGKVNGAEWGPMFKTKHDYAVSDILLNVKGSSYKWCVLSFNIYEMRGSQFVNILNKPIYHRLDKPGIRQQIDVQPEETIVLKAKRKYYVSVAIVDSDASGLFEMPTQFKTSYVRRLATGKKRKLPISPVLIVKGYDV